MKKFTNFNFGDSRMDREWTENGPRMDRSTLATMCRYIAVSFAVLVMSVANVGQAWADTFTPDIDANVKTQDGITVSAVATTGKIGNKSSVPIFVTQNGSLFIYSQLTNITAVSFDVTSSSGGTSTGTVNIDFYISQGGSLIKVDGSTFSTYVTSASTTNPSNSLSSLCQFTVNKDGESSATNMSVSFKSAVKAIELRLNGSNYARIKNLQITYNKSTLPTTYYQAKFSTSTDDQGTVVTGPAGSSITASSDKDTKIEYPGSSGEYYVKAENSETTIDLGSGNTFQIGDEIVIDLMSSGNNKEVGYYYRTRTSTAVCTLTCKITNTYPAHIAYVVKSGDGIAGQQSMRLMRNAADLRVHTISVLRAAASPGYKLSVFNSSTNGEYNFVAGTDENEIVINNFVIPEYTAEGDNKQFWVGPGSYTGHAVNEYFSWKRAYHQQNNSCTDNLTLGSPVNAIGTLHAWTNSGSNNYGLCFEPNGYGIVWGPDGSPWTNVPFESTSDATVWLTDTVLLTSDMITNYKYYVGLLTNSGGYVGSFRNEGDARGLSNTTNISSIRRKTASGDNWADGLIAGHGKFRIWVNNCTQNFYCHYIPHYVLYFNANGGSGAPAADYMSIEESSITISSTEPTRAGYTFAGWNPDEDDADAGTKDGDYDPEDEVTLSNDLTLYAVWSPKEYTITLNGNGGSGHTSSVSATYNSSTLSDAITNPSLDCYTFDGWYSGEGGSGTLIINTSGALQASTAYTGAGGIWTNDGGVTLYAKWSKTPTSLTVSRSGTEATPAGGSPIGTAYTLTCSASTGSISSYQWKQNTTGSKVGAVDAEGTGTTSANFNPVPSDAGNYWYYCVATDACGNEVETELSGCFTFTEPTYSVTYNANLTGTSGSTTGLSGKSNGFTFTTATNGFSRSGYKFKWWNTKSDGTGQDYYAGENDTIAAADQTLYARWDTVASNQAFWSPLDTASQVTGKAINITEGDMVLTSGGATDAADINVDLTADACVVSKHSNIKKHAKVLAIKANDKYIDVHFSDGSPINKLWLGATTNSSSSQNIVVVYSATSDFSTAGGAAHEFKQVGSNSNLVTLPGNTQSTKAITDVSPSTTDTYYYARIYRKISTANSVFDNTANLGSDKTIRIYSIKAQKGASYYTGLSVTKDPSAGSASTPTISATSVEQGSDVTVTAGSAASGYVFLGWESENGTFANASSLSTTFTPTADDAVATAKYAAVKTITIKFLHNGNTEGWTVQGVTTYPADQSYSISVSGDWTVLTFSNVYAVSNINLACTGDDWDYLNTSTKVTDDACYKWNGDAMSCEEFSVTYKANGGTGDDVVVDPATTIASNSFTAPATMAFVGWNTKDDGSGKDYAAGDAVDGNLTLYAQWRYKVYYIGKSEESNDITAALATKYVVSVHTTTGTSYNASDYSDYALVVLSESLTGSDAATTGHELKVIVGLNKPILNLKSYFYNSGRWGWGTPNAGKNSKGIYVKNDTYANLTSHPIYSGLTPNGSDSIVILSSTHKDKKPIQPIGSFESGKEGYTLAKVANNDSGSGTAIHELTAAQRSTITGQSISEKYLLISIYSGDLSHLTTDGKTLIKNAADYLISGSQWVPQYAITKSATNGSIATEVSSSAVTSAAAGSRVDITATPTTGFDFNSWSVYKTGDAETTVSVNSTTTSPTYFTMPAYAVTVAATFVEECTKPGTPTRPTIEDGTLTHAGATFVWDPAGATANSDGYVVSIVKVSDGSTVLDWTSEDINTVDGARVYTATGLTGSTEYYFIVKAIGADGYCAYGDTSRLTFTTLGTPYTITYHLNGASWINEGAATYRYGTGYTLPVAGDMSNTGYSFNGWKNNSGLTGDNITTIGTSESGAKEFWAKWTENTYTVTYDKNGGSGSTMDNTVGHYVTLSTNTYTNSGYVFAGWNTATDGSGASYSEGEEIELKANLDLYAIWATDYTITWDASPKLSGVTAKPNLGGGNYTITASVSAWTGLLDASMISAETSGVTITGVSVNNSASPKTITATFNVGASVVGDKISFTLDVPANGSYSAKSSTEDFDIDRCTGNSSGSDGVLFSAEFKDSGLGTSDICTAANTDYTFTTSELKAAPTGGSIKASTTSTLSHMKFATNAISIAGSDGVIRIDLDNAIATNDLFTYVNVNSSSSAAYLRHTSPTTTTDQIALTVYNSKEAKVRLTSGFNGKTTLYIVRNNNDFKLHKAAVVRPAFLMLLRDDTPTSDTNLSGTDQGLTTENYLAVISGGSATFTSPTSGNLKIKRNNSKNYINFNSTAGYVKIELNDALQEGDVIGFDSYNTNNLALTTTATRSTSIVTTNQLYTVDASSDLKGKTTFYLWQNSGSSDFLRGLQIARSGVAGGGGGTDKISPTLTWDTDLSGGVAAETGDADFTHTVTQDKNSLGAITYSSNNTSVATVNASGKVHIVGAGNATITATMAASGCYKEATVSYNITVTDNCADVAGTISTEDLGCSGVRLTVTGHTTSGETVSYQWYKDGVSLGSVTGAQTASYTATAAGEYYVVVTNTGDGHCAKASTNTITLEDSEAATATKIVNSWYVKNGRRTPDIALVQTTGATDFIVKSGDSPITTFAGCTFYLGTDGIIYLKGQQEDGSAPTGLTSGDETLKFTATACGGNSSELSITIHKQESTTRPSVAFVVDGTKGGDFDAEDENHSVNTELYQYLDYGADETGAFDLTGQNVYSTVDEQAIREHYSQFDAILITDDPSTDTKSGKKSYVDAFGTMIDVRPILTMEAFVSKWGNWKAKGIDGNPESPNPRQYKMKLQCKDHAIFKDLSVGTNVETETIDGVEYWTVTMVDNTKSPYSGVADGTDTDIKPALQGFSADDVSSLLLLGEISEGSLYAGVERQEETAARLMLLGLNAKALPNALTPEGKKVIENALKYLIETDLEKVDDCSNYFTGATDKDWNKDSNWSKSHVPNSPNVRVRILSECVIYSGTYKVAEVDIATSGKSLNKAGEMTGKLTINAGAALIVGGKIRTAEAPYFNTGDLMPTTEEDLVINTSSTAQAALIFNNDAGDTKATVNLYSLGRKAGGYYQFQYYAVPMTYIDVNPAFAGSGIYTYVWKEATGWERRGYYAGLEAFEGVGITTKFADAKTYTMKGTLASTETKEITLTKETDGYNLIGNSWTAPIQISKLEEDNSSLSNKTVYIYNAGNDTVGGGTEGSSAGQWTAIPFDASGFSGWSGMKVIPAMQAFELVPTSEETLKLDYAKVVRGDNKTLTEPLHAPNRNADHAGIELMRIRVADSNTHTDLHLFEGEQFSEEFDNGWEAAYLDGDDGTTKLYADVTLGRMAVVATNELEGTILGFAPGQELEYTFSFGGAGMGYYLNDLKLKKSTPINAENSYTFTFEEGDTNRFYISRTPIEAPQTPTGVDNTHSGEVKAQKFIYNDKMYIMINGRVYSAEGQIVK